MTNEEKDRRDKARDAFYESVNKSEEDLEKKITYISAGTLALSITFIEKFVDFSIADYFYILIIGWFLLVATLSINLISTLTSRKLTMKSVDDIDNEQNETVLRQKIAKRNKIISNLDLSSLITLLSGILLIVIFCSLNLHSKKISTMGEKDIIEKGKLIQSPSTGNNGNSSSSSNGSNSSSGSTSTPTTTPKE